ncbi:MAG: sigma-70 family RNA polymerase sigma factor [Planctomycetes bacterium]|nr:sigma-70 family RNA polymerase sigma factor [Planctomycetota bacterium]
MAVDHDMIVKVLVAQRGKLLAYILSLVQDLHVAEELYQTVLMRALKDSGSVDGPDHLMNWARVVARNIAVDHLRSTGRRAVLLDPDVLNLLESTWRTKDDDADVERTEALRDCLDALSPQARQLIELRYAQDMSMSDVAARIDRPLNSVYVSMSRIYRRLSECIEGKLQPRRANG